MDKERIRAKIDDLEQYAEDLEKDLPDSAGAYVSNRQIRRAVERDFELASETVIDISHMIVAGEGWEKPDDSKDAVSILEDNDLVTADLARSLQDMIGFRNLLVHRYGKIDQDQAFNHLVDGTEDLYAFIGTVDDHLA